MEGSGGGRVGVHLLRAAGSAVLVLFVVMTILAPRRPVVLNPPGFTNAVVALELAGTPEEVLDILGGPGVAERARTVREMVIVTRMDFLFLLAYPLLFVGIALVLSARGGAGTGTVVVLSVLAVVMAAADALENGAILELCRLVEPVRMGPALARLRVFTLVKWEAIALASGVTAVLVWRDCSWWRWSAPLFALAAVLGVGSLVYRAAVEWMLVPSGVAWIMTWLRAFQERSGVGPRPVALHG